MKRVKGSDLLKLTNDENMEDVESFYEMEVECVDGIIVTTNRFVQYMYAFLTYNRRFDVPVYMRQVPPLTHVITPSTHKAWLENTLETIFEHHKGDVRKHDIAPLWLETNDVLIEAGIADLEHMASTVDARDIMTVISDPFISKIRKEMKDVLTSGLGPDVKSSAIVNCNSLLINHVETRSDYEWDMIGSVQQIKADNLKKDQFCQLANVVGYSTEIDSEVYPIINCESFAEGMNYPYTYAINSSLGKKATIYNKSPISETETLNRITQQITSQVEDIDLRDCKSTKTGRVVITPAIKDAIQGMYHMPEGSDEPEAITPEVSEKYLGKEVELRIASGCDSPSQVGVCRICGGESMTNFVDDYNVGGASSCYVFGQNSQLILKTKHVDIINFDTEGTIATELKPFLKLSRNGKDVFIRDSCNEASISFLAVRRVGKDRSSNGQFLQTVFSVKSLDGAELTSFGEIDVLSLAPNNGLDDPVFDVKLKPGSLANFSYDLLQFIRANPDRLTMQRSGTNKTAYTISLKGFESSKPIFNIPFRHFDSLSLHKQLEMFFLSPGKKPNGEVLTDYTSFTEALIALCRMTYPHLGTRMGILQIILLAFTVRDVSKGDYRISFNGDACTFGKLETIRRNRSLSVVTIASGQGNVFGHLSPFVKDNMLPHQYDGQYT